MKSLSWLEAAAKVLEEERKSMHYTDIAQLIFEREYRNRGGATPANTLNRDLNENIKELGVNSKFVKIGRGEFALRRLVDTNSLDNNDFDSITVNPQTEKIKNVQLNPENNRILNAFGIYWNRALVHWKSTPDLLGIQQIGALEVNFKEQRGIYLLHDSREIIYVGQAIDRPLGERLKHHTADRLSGRWDRFSWFGFYSVTETGDLNVRKTFESISIQNLGDLLEAILIESVEPRQNRKQGNTFFGLEFLQQEAPEIKKKKKQEMIKELTDRL